jgi:inhibitor of KinA sporulation pathway (predicted exonuclease)
VDVRSALDPIARDGITSRRMLDHLVVLDFEATCDRDVPPEPQEVIEFPSVLISLADRRVVDEFGSFVRPVHHPRLTEFCTELTTIKQADVDGAPPFAEVLAAHRAWLDSHRLERFAFVTCGDWDFGTLFPMQCAAAGVSITDLPRAYRRWINVKLVFAAVTMRPKSIGMTGMLEALGHPLVGTHHRGIDDCHNIAKIAIDLAHRGATFDFTSKLSASKYPPLPIELALRGRTEDVVLQKRAMASLIGLASGTFRTKIIRFRTEDGVELDDERLSELPSGVRLIAE